MNTGSMNLALRRQAGRQEARKFGRRRPIFDRSVRRGLRSGLLGFSWTATRSASGGVLREHRAYCLSREADIPGSRASNSPKGALIVARPASRTPGGIESQANVTERIKRTEERTFEAVNQFPFPEPDDARAPLESACRTAGKTGSEREDSLLATRCDAAAAYAPQLENVRRRSKDREGHASAPENARPFRRLMRGRDLA